MIKEIIATGKDVSEAKENARAALGAGELDDVKFEILHMGSRGIFGIIGVKPAQVKAFIEIPDREERRPRRDKKKKPAAPVNKNEAQAEAPATVEENAPAAEVQHKSNKKKKHKSHKSENRPEGKNEPKAAAEPKERTQVIPEVELKMERREVAEGEDMSYDFIRTVILDIGLDATAELYACEDGTRRIAIKGNDASTLIGHHGDTLDALQYLANLASARKNVHGERDKSRVTLDIEGYRAKREETLRALARRMAAKAIRNNRSVMLEPMSAYERRIIHSEIQGIEGVSTNSIGSDNNRKIVIYLTDKKPKGVFEEDKEESISEDTIGAFEQSALADGSDENETVSIEYTTPDESEEIITSDDEGIK